MSSEDTIASKTRMFKGTIAVTVIYAVFILLMAVAGFISSSARELLFTRYLTFTATFITGTVIIIAIIVIQLFAKTPKKDETSETKYSGESLSCPDFWVLKRTPQEQLNKIEDSQIREKSKFYCENPRVSVDVDIPVSLKETDASKELEQMATMYNTSISEQYHMKCNRMYPDYMTHIDRKAFKENPTTLRCNYRKECSSTDNHIPWSGIC